MLSLRVCFLLTLMVGLSACKPTPTQPNSIQEDDDAAFSAYWSIAAVACLVAIVAMCASPADPPGTSQPNGAIASMPPHFTQPRGPIRAPVATPAAPVAADYGEIVRPSAAAPPPDAEAGPAFIREIVNGQLEYRQVSLDEVDALIAKGEQVFRPSNRQDAGQDIYEAVTTVNDLYASVTPKGAASGTSPPGMDLYASPNKSKPASDSNLAATVGASQAAPNDYDPPVYATPSLPTLAPPPAGGVGRPGYVNQDVFAQAQQAAKADGMAREGNYVPQAEQAPPTQQMLYEPVDSAPAAAPTAPTDLERWMNTALTREEAAGLLTGKTPGTYLVRRSVKDGSFVLCLSGKLTYNFKIVERKGKYGILDDQNPNPPFFSSILRLLDHFKRIDPKATGGLPVQLKDVLPFSAYRR
eukprot:m.74608 g.74608  ORF g.74608 m.74608 type:complete len:412 (+) comp14369_c0_seq1:122-1357(+)